MCCMIDVEKEDLMSEKQLSFAWIWMGLFMHDHEAILHQLDIKTDWSIEGLSDEEAYDVWDFIRDYVS
jgi:uncharacterized membrane-anchored protein YjiN (DUF445 family)